MLKATRPDFVVALGRHSRMAAIANDLIDAGYPFLMEKPMSINAAELEPVADKAAKRNAYIAVPLAQRYGAFAKRARKLLAAKAFGPLSHIYVRINRPAPPRYAAWDCPWMMDPAEAGRRLAQSRPAWARHVPAPDRRGGGGGRRAVEPPRA